MAHAFSCQEMNGSAWRCEFDEPLDTCGSEGDPTEEESRILLATSAKKQRTEVRLSSLTEEEKQEFDRAKKSEIQNWIRTSTIRQFSRTRSPKNKF